MKKRLILPLLILSLIVNLYFLFGKYFSGRLPFKEEEILRGRVVRVIDGDTFDVEEGVRVRLAGVEAPEYPRGCLSEETKERLKELLLGKEVEVEVIGKDSFGRKIGFVTLNGVFVNRVLVEEGLARVTDKDSKYAPILLAREDEAKKLKRRIWSSLCLPKEGCVIKGNVRRDKETRIYHLPECFNYEKIVVNEREGDRWFCSEEEAKAAGFRKSEDCPK